MQLKIDVVPLKSCAVVIEGTTAQAYLYGLGGSDVISDVIIAL